MNKQKLSEDEGLFLPLIQIKDDSRNQRSRERINFFENYIKLFYLQASLNLNEKFISRRIYK